MNPKEKMDSPSGAVIGKSAFWSVLNQSIGQILSLAAFLITARFVSKEAFGAMAIAFLAIEFFRQVTIESVGISLAAKQNPNKNDYNAGFIIILAGSVLSALVMYLTAPLVASFLDNPDIETALELTSVVLLAMGLSRTHETWMAKNMKFKILAIRSLIAIGIGGAVGIYMAMHGYGLISLIAQQILTSIIGAALLWVSSSWKPGLSTSGADIKELLSYSKHVSMNALTGVIGAQSDTFFASYYLGAAATGVYNASKRILVATQTMITSGLNSVALPVFSTKSDNSAALKETFFQAVSYTLLLTAPFYVGLACLSDDIIAIVLGNKWADAAPVLSILAFTALLAGIDLYSSNIRLVMNRPHWQTYITLLNAVVNVAILLVVARHGLHALALAMVAKSLLIFPVSLILTLNLLQATIGEYLRKIWAIVLSALGMGIAVCYTQEMFAITSPLLNVAVLTPAGAAVYLAILYILDKKKVVEVVLLMKNIAASFRKA